MASSSKYFDPTFQFSLLHPKFWLSWIGVAILILFGIMPAWLRDPIARKLAVVVRLIAAKQLNVARANLKACFPDKSKEEIEGLVKENVEHFIVVLLAQAELVFGSEKLIRQRVKVHGIEHVHHVRAQNQAIIFLIPHVWGIEYGGLRLNLELPMVAMAKAHRNGLFNWFSNRMRSSMGGKVYKRQAGIRALLAELKQGNSFFYLPDEDHGEEKSVFAPFFATQKATLPVVGRLSHAGNAQVLPVTMAYNMKAKHFDLTIREAIEPESMQGKENEALALNTAMEQTINAFPEQYMWFLKILRTRPKGEPYLY